MFPVLKDLNLRLLPNPNHPYWMTHLLLNPSPPYNRTQLLLDPCLRAQLQVTLNHLLHRDHPKQVLSQLYNLPLLTCKLNVSLGVQASNPGSLHHPSVAPGQFHLVQHNQLALNLHPDLHQGLHLQGHRLPYSPLSCNTHHWVQGLEFNLHAMLIQESIHNFLSHIVEVSPDTPSLCLILISPG